MDSILTVTTAASDLSLLSASELREAIGQPTASDAAVATLGKRVSAAITRACRVTPAGAVPPTLRLESMSEQFRPASSRDRLILARRPAIEIVSATENDTALDVDDDIEIDAAAGLLYRLSSDERIDWSSGKIVVAYRAGWETVPDDLKHIAAELAQHFHAEAQQQDANLRSLDIPGVISMQRWVDNSNTAPIPEHLQNALAQGGYVNHWIG